MRDLIARLTFCLRSVLRVLLIADFVFGIPDTD